LHLIQMRTRWSLGHRPRIASLQPQVRGCDTRLRSRYHLIDAVVFRRVGTR